VNVFGFGEGRVGTFRGSWTRFVVEGWGTWDWWSCRLLKGQDSRDSVLHQGQLCFQTMRIFRVVADQKPGYWIAQKRCTPELYVVVVVATSS